MGYKVSVDVGGTFTDVVVSDGASSTWFGKALTDVHRAYAGIRNAIDDVAGQIGTSVDAILGDADVLLYGTTRATNAIVEGKTARTGLIVTEGFRDILTLREGGKLEPFNYGMAYPEPYVPRSLTWQIAERVGADGRVVRPLDEDSVTAAVRHAQAHGVEALAVCLLWSVANATHEVRVGQLIDEVTAGDLPYTLSHRLNPIVREYRRASSTAIDASLKPLMQAHLRELDTDLRSAGFSGALLVATSFGGAWQISDAIDKPIYTVGSGPAMAPRAATFIADKEADVAADGDIVVCDAGGTTFDVSVVSERSITQTNEAWLGEKFTGHMLGISCVDVRSLGAGGGSIAWIDPGGLLRVGPHSAGANPGPVAYGQGGDQPTVTDAAVVLGYLSHGYFFGGRLDLQVEASRRAIENKIARPLGLSVEHAAAGIMRVASEHMVAGIKDVTVNQGVDPRHALVVAGGGAGGLNIVQIATELGCTNVVVPKAAGVLSAYGGHNSDIVTEIRRSLFQESARIDYDAVGALLTELDGAMDDFASRLPVKVEGIDKQVFVESRYVHQLWELAVPLPSNRLANDADLKLLVEEFHRLHEKYYAVREDTDKLELLTWVGRVTVRFDDAEEMLAAVDSATPDPVGRWPAYFADTGEVETPRFDGATLKPGHEVDGPMIILEPTTTIVVDPGWSARVSSTGNYFLRPVSERD